MSMTIEPSTPAPGAHKTPRTLRTRLLFKAAFSVGVTMVWLALSLVAAARGDWVMMGIDIAGVVTGIAALVWAGHALLQVSDVDTLAEFAYRLAEQRFDALLAEQISIAEGDRENQWLQ